MTSKKLICASILFVATTSANADPTIKPDGQWRGSVNGGFSAASGNTTSTSLNVAANLARATATNRFTADLTGLYGTTGGGDDRTVSDNLIKFRTEYDHDLNPKIYALATLDAQRNELQDLNFSSAAALGLGRHVIATPSTTFNIFSGLSYNYEAYKSESRNYPELLFGEEFNQKLSSNTALTERLSVYPNLGYPGSYRTQLDVGLITSITDRLNLKIALSNSYQNRPVDQVKKTDTQIITSIGYNFGPK